MLTFSEFKNILQLIASDDLECNILAKELLRPFVYEINENEIWLNKDFSFKYYNGGWFKWSNGAMSGPIPI